MLIEIRGQESSMLAKALSVLRFAFVSVLLFAAASQFLVSATVAESSEDEATSALASAEGAVVSAYQAVLGAEEAGANASGLLVRLNEAGGYLAQAHMACRLGDFDEATRSANLSRSIGEEVQNDAVALKDSALSDSLQRMVLTMIASVLGVVLIALGSLWVWLLLKKRYRQYRSWFIFGSLALMVAAAYPISASYVHPPGGSERFSELWLLGPGHKAEDYPFNVRVNEMCSVYVGVGNHLGSPAYYRIFVKFRNQTEPLPVASNATPSPLPELYEFDFFVRDSEVWETLLNFRIVDVIGYDNYMIVNRLLVNEMVFQLSPPSLAMWNRERSGFYYQLFFELWLYNMTSQSFGFHNRFVGIWLNATG